MRIRKKSNSQLAGIDIVKRTRYMFCLLIMHVQGLFSENSFIELGNEIEFMSKTTRELTQKSISQSRILELGFGQRPFRLFALQSLGYNARGIDLDVPIYGSIVRQSLTIIHRNGFYRCLKTLIRHLIFDRPRYRDLDRFLRKHGASLRPSVSQLIVGDLADEKTWQEAGSEFDLIYSFDVLEHIPNDQIEKVLRNIYNHMGQQSIAVLVPMVFTGISGGHDLGWYPHQVDQLIKRGPAWGHLTGDVDSADTYLNRMTLAEFRSEFARLFIIEDERSVFGRLGAQYLTDQRRVEIPSEFDDSELFSNKVIFTLRKKCTL